MKNLLITGINGFLGSALSRRLSQEFNIIGLLSSRKRNDRIQDEDIKLYYSGDSIKRIFDENEIYGIIHTATVYHREKRTILDLIDTNIKLPLELYELANIYGVPVFINTDSFFSQKQSIEYSYLSQYTLSKRHIIEWLNSMADKCKIINMIIYHMYGPGDSSDKFMTQLIDSLKQNKKNIDATYGNQTRDFIFISDVVDAYYTVIKHINDFEKITEVEVGTGVETSIRELMLCAKYLTHSSTEIHFGAIPYRDGEIMKSVADNNLLKSFNWKPHVDIKTGLSSMV